MLAIPPYLVKRRKQHFHHLEEYGVDLVLGCNGFIWVGEHAEITDDMVEDQVNKTKQLTTKPERNSSSLEEQERTFTSLETRQHVCKIANAVRILSTVGFLVSLEVIMEIVALATSLDLDIHEMLGSEFCVLVAEREVERRTSTRKKV